MKPVNVIIGSGAIAQAIARRISIGKHILLADIRPETAEQAAKTLREAGFECSTAVVNVAERESVAALAQTAQALGDVAGVVHTAGLSPSQAAPQDILRVDLYGTALVFEYFGDIIAPQGAAVVIGSQSSHRLKVDELTQQQADDLALLPAEELLNLPFVRAIDDSLRAYQIAKRGNALRVQAEAVRWGKRGARINCISAGIVFTPLAYDELTSPERGAFYRDMLAKSPAGRNRRLGRTPVQPQRRLHHRQRHSDRWRRNRVLQIRRAIKPIPEGEVPPVMENRFGNIAPMKTDADTFRRLTQIPIVIYFGDFIPDAPNGTQGGDQWYMRMKLAQDWVNTVNKHGGKATLVHLPKVGIKGNTHFPFSDLNNQEVAEHLAGWLKEKGLDK